MTDASQTAAVASEVADNAKTYWIPLESNPDVLTEFGQRLGVPAGVYRFTDVWGLEEAVLSFVLRPVLAVVMLFPISEAYETHRKAEDAKIMEAGAPVDPSIVFFRQTVGNACGTIGLLHALANNVTDLGIESGSVVARILEEGKGKTPMERGKLLEKSNALADIHADMGTTGQTEAPAADSDVNLHFVCFVRGAEGHCWELDGRRPAAIDRGACDDLLTGAATVIQEYIDREEGNLNFVMLALCPAEE